MKTRKELKEQYKQMKYKIGVFCIKNKLNGKVFLGSSTDLVAIWHSTKLQLELNSFPNSELQKDWNEYGSANFEYSIVDEITQKDDYKGDYGKDAKALEEVYLEQMEPFGDKGYNRRSQISS